MDKLHFYWDAWRFLLVTGDSKSWRDAIGRLMEWLYAHGKLNEKNEALEECLILTKTGYVLLRHPAFAQTFHNKRFFPDPNEYELDKHKEIFASRDHWSYFIQYKKNTLSKEEFIEFIKLVPRMRGMNLWMGTMTGDKFSEWWFYTLFNPGAYLGNIISNLITWIGRLGPEESIHWWIRKDSFHHYRNNGLYLQHNLTRWQKWWRRRWVIITPFYPIQNRAWQLKWLPDSKRKERQKQILLRRTDKDNPIVRLLFGDKTVTKAEVNAYPETTGDASGIKLNKSCDRTIEEIHNTENCYKSLLVCRLYDELNPK